ncbi:MAG TPA: AAA family ATPase [Candidatus Sulfotelmatobacter sp.]|nr:AAA family ATPase [Candidatus Sulfotelmatobacter sp.]
MLTRVYIDNFRSFVNFEYKPEREQLLLGPNGSGKSSLLDAILYVKRLIDGDENPFTQSTRTRWQDKPLQIVEIEALLDGRKYEYRVEIGFKSETRPSVNLERLRVSGATVFELANGEIRFFPSEGVTKPIPLWTTKSAMYLSQMSNSHVQRFVEWMKGSVHCLRIDAYPGAMDESADSEEQVPDYELENIAGWYRYLVGAYPEENLKFVESMKAALDGFQTLRFSSEEDGVKKLRADFTTSTNRRVSYSLSELSEGQRYLLALYMALHFLIARGYTVFIDEPDNFISLREIQPWLLAAEEAVEDHRAQLILISHHPEILNQWAQEHGLRFFREDNGHVRTEKFKTDPDGNLQPSELIARGQEDE